VKTFRVWIQPSDYGFYLLVDGVENAVWLLDRLGRSFVFRSAEPIAEQRNSPFCTFQVAGGPQLTLRKLQQLLVAIPEVTLLRVAVAS
jgi:hypothetical protein